MNAGSCLTIQIERGAPVRLERSRSDSWPMSVRVLSRLLPLGGRGAPASSLPPVAEIALVAVLIAGLPQLAGRRPRHRVTAAQRSPSRVRAR